LSDDVNSVATHCVIFPHAWKFKCSPLRTPFDADDDYLILIINTRLILVLFRLHIHLNNYPSLSALLFGFERSGGEDFCVNVYSRTEDTTISSLEMFSVLLGSI
jgi:hypothetical protein